jgi:hypothetical protein
MIDKIEKTICGIDVYFTDGSKLFITNAFLSSVYTFGSSFGNDGYKCNPKPSVLHGANQRIIDNIITIVEEHLTFEGHGENIVAYVSNEDKEKISVKIRKLINREE